MGSRGPQLFPQNVKAGFEDVVREGFRVGEEDFDGYQLGRPRGQGADYHCCVGHGLAPSLAPNHAWRARSLISWAALPNATVQVLPAVAHPANASGFIVTDDAALCEHVKGSYVYTDEQSVTSLVRLFDTLRGECYRVSESLALLTEVGEIWTGESQPTQTPTAERA